jgi:hypothetical protein
MVQDQLDDAMRDWQGMVDEGWGKGDPQRATARGKVRGLAVALATLLSPHAPNARGVERESLARVKDEDGTQ